MTTPLEDSGIGFAVRDPHSTAIEVRIARPDDLPWLLAELKNLAAGFGTTTSLYPREDYARDAVTSLIEAGPFFIAEREADGTRLGFIAGTLGPHPFNPDILVLTELFSWVPIAFRGTFSDGTAAAAHLFRAFHDFGKQNAHWIVVNTPVGREGTVPPSALERRGYHPHEVSHLLEVEPCSS